MIEQTAPRTLLLHAYQDYNVIFALGASGWAWKHMGWKERKGKKRSRRLILLFSVQSHSLAPSAHWHQYPSQWADTSAGKRGSCRRQRRGSRCGSNLGNAEWMYWERSREESLLDLKYSTLGRRNFFFFFAVKIDVYQTAVSQSRAADKDREIKLPPTFKSAISQTYIHCFPLCHPHAALCSTGKKRKRKKI